MPDLVHFEISADDLERASRFYRNVFGWMIESLEGPEKYKFITTNEDEFAVTGGLTERFHPTDSTVNTFDVPSLDSFARRITEAGGRVLAPKIAIPGEGYVQYCQDTEGNVFGIIEYDELAQ